MRGLLVLSLGLCTLTLPSPGLYASQAAGPLPTAPPALATAKAPKLEGAVGTITALGKNQLTVEKDLNGGAVTVLVDAHTQYHGPRLGIRFKDLRAGDHVIVALVPGEQKIAKLVDVIRPAAKTPAQAPPRPADPPPHATPAAPDPQAATGNLQGIAGEISAIVGDRLTVKRPSGRTVTMLINSQTRFEGNGISSLSNLKVGQRVVAVGEASGSPMAAKLVSVVAP